MNREDVICEIAERYRQLGRPLNEFERRHWAATEAIKLGRGGITIVSQALRISPNTIKRGIQEIATGEVDSYSTTNSRIRKPGGGRKSKKTVDRLTRTGSKKETADVEPQLPATAGSVEHRYDTVPILTDADAKLDSDKSLAPRPDSFEIP